MIIRYEDLIKVTDEHLQTCNKIIENVKNYNRECRNINCDSCPFDITNIKGDDLSCFKFEVDLFTSARLLIEHGLK